MFKPSPSKTITFVVFYYINTSRKHRNIQIWSSVTVVKFMCHFWHISQVTSNDKYIYLPLKPSRMRHMVNFQEEINRFEFRVFLLLEWLPYLVKRAKSTLILTHTWREYNWIHICTKSIDPLENTNSLFLDLNLDCHIHLHWQYSIYHARLRPTSNDAQSYKTYFL